MRLRQVRKRWWLVGAGVLVLAPLVGFGWWLFSPLLFDKTVNEEFAFATSVSETPTGSGGVLADAATVATPLRTGQFSDIDRVHQGSGTATIYQLPDGSLVLRLEDLDVTNGPDLHVYLAEHENPRDRGQLDQGYVDLGELKGNKGNQTYELPPGFDVAAAGSVVIYCEPFHVVFSIATLAPNA